MPIPAYALTSLWIDHCSTRPIVQNHPELLTKREKIALAVDALAIALLVTSAILITLQCNNINLGPMSFMGSSGMAPAFALYGYTAFIVIANLAKYAIHSTKLHNQSINRVVPAVDPNPAPVAV